VLHAPALPNPCAPGERAELVNAGWSNVGLTWGGGQAGPVPGSLGASQALFAAF